MGRETEHESMMFEDQLGVGDIIAGDAPLDERSFAAGDLG